LKDDPTLKTLGIILEIGRVKTNNKNPLAEIAVAEVEHELRRQAPDGRPVTPLGLSKAISRLNSRLPREGLSAYKLWTHRDQYSHVQTLIDDVTTISYQHQQRHKIQVGDLVYLRTERDKHKARNRYLVTSINHPWCFVKKFTAKQIRAASYQVRLEECYRVPSQLADPKINHPRDSDSDDEVLCPEEAPPMNPPSPPAVPAVLQADPSCPSPSTSARPQRTRNPPKYFEYEHSV
jgi:hypothetical protein